MRKLSRRIDAEGLTDPSLLSAYGKLLNNYSRLIQIFQDENQNKVAPAQDEFDPYEFDPDDDCEWPVGIMRS